ncbi:MAG TPA: VacJ family lipoprotein [Pseudomonadales bacterium]
MDTLKSRLLGAACGALFALSALPLQAAEAAAPPAEEEALDEEFVDDEEFFVFDEDEDESATAIADPLERVNRVTFAFNDKMYRVVLLPIARGLRVLPEPVRIAGSNFFDNLTGPVSSFSALLQGDVRNSATELGRFVLNTTAGMAGLFDVATDVGLEADREDLGQTMGKYGIGHGFYLVLPFAGPSSLRDAVGLSTTQRINPLYDNLHTDEVIAINVVQAEIALSLDRDTYVSMYDQALDPYAFFRSAWVQNRAGQVAK